jgi:uncharacterized protein with NRDE domain
MCTLIALHHRVRGASLVVAANRDEFLARPAQGPAVREVPAGRIVAPLDVQAGGTWLGLSARGVFAAVTNIASPDPDPQRRSRGLLVLDALAAGSAREAAEKACGLPLHAYNPFNLLVADAEGMFAISYRDVPRRVGLPDGVAVVGNAPLDAPPPAKLSGLRERALRTAAGPDGPLAGLAGICRDHSEGARGALDALCVHTPAYGTRSSTLLLLSLAGPGDPASQLLFADGPPCATRYEDFTPLLRDLGGRPGVQGAEGTRKAT